ncbi:MAG: iron chelate uptake ABC transporter family permease subunit [Candidatus Thermoplasmatota archaeon]|nr:iron chelate uptake ABC transporter family permease subunit [Candidatus Thermoplasmatota archaeon]
MIELRKGALPFMAGSLIALLLAVLVGTLLGPVRIPPPSILRILLSLLPGAGGLFDGPEGWRTIIVQIRLPMVIMGIAVGIALSSSGSALQGLFRNDLVDPFIIGISAGGALGWVIGNIVTDGWAYASATAFKVVFSFLLSLGSVVLAYMIARRGSKLPISNLLLAGIAVSALFTSIAQVAIYLFVDNPAEMIFSLMGGLGNTRWHEVAIVLPISVLGAAALSVLGRDINAFAAGEGVAAHLGVEVERSKFMIIAISALITAVTIPFCGVIGFVGLMIPHIARRFVGPDQRILIPSSALLGGGFLVLCDILSRSISVAVIPLGMITGLIGGGFFLYLLASRRGVR